MILLLVFRTGTYYDTASKGTTIQVTNSMFSISWGGKTCQYASYLHFRTLFQMKPKRKLAETASKCPCCPTTSGRQTSSAVNKVITPPQAKRVKKTVGKRQARAKLPTLVPTTTAEEPLVETIQPIPPDCPESSDSSTEEENVEDNSTTSESSDDEDYFDTAVSSHLQDIVGGNVAQFHEPISTSISAQIKKSLRKKIWCNKFVDFSLLLPSANHSSSPQFSLQVDKFSNINVVPTKRQKTIATIESWTSAFIRFTSVYTEKFPTEAPALMKYAEIVRDLAARSKGLAWSYYDTQFRLLREQQAFPWDRLHTEFWLMASTFQPPVQPSSFQSFRTGQAKGPQKPYNRQQKYKAFLDNTCWTFNRRKQCNFPRCPHPHVCGFCRGNHAASDCSFATKEQGLSTNSPQTHPQATPFNRPKK